MVEYAKKQSVETILIAGDLFDSERVKGSTVDILLSTIQDGKNIDFLYLKGNHDEAQRAFLGRELPDNLKTFSDKWTCYRYGDVCVTGVELTDRNFESIYDQLQLEESNTNIVMMHGQVSTQCGPDQICLQRLRGKNIDYLALGHLHSHKCDRLDIRGEYCYSGCLEGRGFDECGDKGFVLLDVVDGRCYSEFIPFSKRTLFDVPVDITGLTTIPEIHQAMNAAAEGISADSLVKFTLCGTYALDTKKDFRFLLQNLEPRYYFVKIKDESRLQLEPSDYEHDISLKGEFIRTVMASDRTDAEKQKIITWGIQALKGEEIVI